jgi:hypothetical protein
VDHGWCQIKINGEDGTPSAGETTKSEATKAAEKDAWTKRFPEARQVMSGRVRGWCKLESSISEAAVKIGRFEVRSALCS